MCYHTHFLGHPIFFMIEFRMLETPKQLTSILHLYYKKTGRFFSAERLWEQRTMFFSTIPMSPSGPFWAQHLSFCANLTESKPRASLLNNYGALPCFSIGDFH